MLGNSFLLILGVGVLWFGADRFISGGRIIAESLGVSTLMIGLTLGAIGTSMPEMMVSWIAAAGGMANISIGNVVGSNMANIGLALGLGALIFPIPVEKEVIKYDYWALIITVILFYLVTMNFEISRLEGLILLSFYMVYVALLVGRHYRSRYKSGKSDKRNSFGKGGVYLLIGIAGLLIGAKIVVDIASDMARYWGITETVIGITVVAIGTSLPEMAVVLAGSFKKAPGISMGTIIGSNIINVLLVAGGASIITSINLEPGKNMILAPAVLLFSVLLLPIIIIDRKITRLEGLLLFTAYAGYIYLVI